MEVSCSVATQPRHGRFTSLLKNSCHSGNDPEAAVRLIAFLCFRKGSDKGGGNYLRLQRHPQEAYATGDINRLSI
jgi:hypothetical protein